MRNIKLTVAYDGTHYHGFQRQNNAMTIQEILETKLAIVLRHPIKMIGAGRTDAKVHAQGQVVNFYTDSIIPTERIAIAANSVLPNDIVVSQAEEKDGEFNARFSACSKIYRYKLYHASFPDPFLRNYAWHYPWALNRSRMKEALQFIVGTHDFSAFRASGSAPANPVKTILYANCQVENTITILTFWGTGFLYHMVRNLVGTVIEVGRGRKSVDEFYNILVSKNRSLAGVTAPPQGLYLEKVFY